jgi:hypothetical protein
LTKRGQRPEQNKKRNALEPKWLRTFAIGASWAHMTNVGQNDNQGCIERMGTNHVGNRSDQNDNHACIERMGTNHVGINITRDNHAF